MKKILLLGMLIVGGLAYGRDYEYRERQELQAVENVQERSETMIAREREISKENIEKYSEFHRDLDNMDRGHDNN